MKLLILFFLLPSVLFGQSKLAEAETLLEKKEFAKAQSMTETYVQENPNDLKGIELLGDVYGQQKKWDGAIENYKKLVETSPKTADYHYKYGGALGMKALEVNKLKALGMLDDIKEAFHTAANLDTKHIGARWALVKMYMQMPGIVGGSKNKALSYADELEKLSKVDGYLAKGYIYDYDDDIDLAESNYKKAVVTGGSVTCYKEMVAFYIKREEPQKALTYLKEGYKIHKEGSFLKQINQLEQEN